MKQFLIIALIMLLASLNACESPDMPIQYADNYDKIVFSVQSQKRLTRTNPYEAYDPQRHPETMGVFGYQDLAQCATLTPTSGLTVQTNPIFFNEIATYNASKQSWETSVMKRWIDYPQATSFDFFAYMPQNASATLNRTDADTYKLAFAYAHASNAEDAPILLNNKAAPIICALPHNKTKLNVENGNRVIDFKFDQTLTCYRLLFMLDKKMNAIRHFRVKRVTLSGKMATACTISRSYIWNTTTQMWRATDISWTDMVRHDFSETPYPIPYKGYGTNAYDENSQTAIVTAADYTQWGPDFYAIPDAQFQPLITVTYDVELTAEDGKTVVTRKDVTSSITLNKNNFANLSTGKTAMINPIRILIQPRYLYVLADQDAYTGHLLID